ncbi:MAG TPA: sigma-70 family RNA polymerase sigma factor [Candidatus Agathobaculum pullicola]|uniref:RNA polymerase sigma factor n=1 Tax=Candidatus Agathobaculum pullicola TaxID=2838426 RepID=UPI001F96622F|nr:sigma-70 family RNA polymerase sigma factor [Candidatus Agathobaculum pullicola]
MDEQIFALLSAGDAEGVTLLQKQYGPMVQYIVRGILRDAQDTEECVSDVFLHVWERFASFDPKKGTLAAWMTVVARNAAVDRLRRRHAPDDTWEEQAGASPSPEDVVLRRERTRLLQKAVDALGASEQLLFYRKYYYLQSTAQIAAEMGLTERAVEGRLYRLRRRLQKALGGDAL